MYPSTLVRHNKLLAFLFFYIRSISAVFVTIIIFFSSRLKKSKLLLVSVKYQPIVDLHRNQWRGAEALLRISLRGKQVSPAIFLTLPNA